MYRSLSHRRGLGKIYLSQNVQIRFSLLKYFNEYLRREKKYCFYCSLSEIAHNSAKPRAGAGAVSNQLRILSVHVITYSDQYERKLREGCARASILIVVMHTFLLILS